MNYLKNNYIFKPTLLNSKLNTFLLLGQITALSFIGISSAQALGGVSHINYENIAAIPSNYSISPHVYQWGVAVDKNITSLVYNGTTYEYESLADKVEIRRVNNDLSRGERCTLFVESGGNKRFKPTYPALGDGSGNCDMAKVMGGRTINIGALDVFNNQPHRDNTENNIERVDFIFTSGITAPQVESLAKTGHIVAEKGGNNPVKIAAILTLDSNNEPETYGSLISVRPSGGCNRATTYCYRQTNFSSYNWFIANERKPLGSTNDDHSYPSYIRGASEHLGMVFVPLSALGVPADSTYYGFSYFGDDVNITDHTLNDPSTFPTTSNGKGSLSSGEADIYGGVAGYFMDESCATGTDCGTTPTTIPVVAPPLSFGSQGCFNLREVNHHIVREHKTDRGADGVTPTD